MRKKQADRLILFLVAFIILAVGMAARIINKTYDVSLVKKIEYYCVPISLVLFICLLFSFLIDNKIYKGFKYFWVYFTTKNSLELQMIDAGFKIQRSYYIDIPRIVLSFSKDYSSGLLKIRNNLKFDKRLDDVVMSSALGRFIVERHYLTDDGNYYIYELVDGSVSFKMTFNNFAEFKKYSDNVSTYKLFLDGRSTIKLQHTLLVGMTGSGKTYSLYSLLLQMLYKDVPYVLFYADPKGSSLAVIGQAVDETRTSVGVEEIILSLEDFVSLMRKRKTELKEKLSSKIDADYSDFGMQPYIFICDEYASFASVIAGEDKKTRDKVKALLYEIILQGRQLGFFLFLIMQKSDATLIDTALRDNIPLKIVLGNSETQTYVTTFGASADIPKRHYTVGEGVFTEPTLAPEPKLVQFPYCNFDILQSCKDSPDSPSSRGVTTGAPEGKE